MFWGSVVLAALLVADGDAAVSPGVNRGAKTDGVTLTFLDGGKVVFRYRYGGVPYKPYADLFVSPAGVNILRDSPEDHKHHHALMYAVTVDGVNFWEEAVAPGVQRGEPPVWTARGFTQRIDWVRPADSAILLAEDRRIVLLSPAGAEVSLIDWTSSFTLPEGKPQAEITGSHYHGLGMRFLVSMDQGGRFEFSEGADAGEAVRGTENLTRARWCAYAAQADGNPVTVAVFDDPANPRHPAWWFTMTSPFAYLSATLNLHREPLVVRDGESVALHYGVALWDGSPAKDDIETVYALWLNASRRGTETSR